jgi:hypothetical protein
MANREEHLGFCKKRALQYLEYGKVRDAFSSINSDLQSHPETKDHPGITLGMMQLMDGKLNTCEEMRKFIEGFN